MNKSLKKQTIIYFIGILVTLCFHSFISQQIEFVTYNDSYFRIQDYAYYIIIAKAFWFDGFGNIYEIFFHQKALSMHIGAQVHYVMPLGVTPVALIVWLPFVYLAELNMAFSYTLWITFSIGTLITALWRVGKYAFQEKKLDLLPITLSFVTIFSVTMGITILLGQTSPLAAGLLIHLIFLVYKAGEKFNPSSGLLILFILFLLGIKPTYLALGLGLLIIYGKWREAFYSLILVLVVLIGLTPFLGVEWLSSYPKSLTIYAQENIPAIHSWSIAFETMNIFRSAFRNVIGDSIASIISTIVTCGVYMSVIVFSVFAKITNKSTFMISPLRITKGHLFIIITGSYLLFSPYAGGYEDILFLPIFIMVLLIGDTPNLTNYKSLVMVFFLFTILSHDIFPPNKPLWFFWILKTIILGSTLNFCRSTSERKSRENSLIKKK